MFDVKSLSTTHFFDTSPVSLARWLNSYYQLLKPSTIGLYEPTLICIKVEPGSKPALDDNPEVCPPESSESLDQPPEVCPPVPKEPPVKQPPAKRTKRQEIPDLIK